LGDTTGQSRARSDEYPILVLFQKNSVLHPSVIIAGACATYPPAGSNAACGQYGKTFSVDRLKSYYSHSGGGNPDIMILSG
jgi:hypothetical protein